MVVYLDILLFLNLFVNFFLLRAVSGLCRVSCSFWRLLLGAAVGAAVSLTIFLPALPAAVDLLIKLLCAAGMVLAAFSFGSVRRWLRLCGATFAVSFGFAGVMMAVWLIFRPSGMAVSGNAVYFNISPLLLIASTVLSYGLLRLIAFLTERRAANTSVYTLTIQLGAQAVTCDALLDTGHHLTDLYSGNPVVVAQYDLVESLLPVPCRSVFAGTPDAVPAGLEERFRLIPYTAVGGQGFLPAFLPDRISVSHGGQTYSTGKVTVAVSAAPMTAEYKALIGRGLVDFLSE